MARSAPAHGIESRLRRPKLGSDRRKLILGPPHAWCDASPVDDVDMSDRCRRRIRVAGVFDNPLLRHGIASFIGSLKDMEWIDDVVDSPQLIEHFLSHVPDQVPDVVLVDLQLQSQGGLALIKEVRKKVPTAEVVALTTYNSEVQARAALRAGAKGFLMKDTVPDDLAEAIRAVHSGETRLPPAIVLLLAHSLVQNELSVREIEVLRLVAEFSATKTIAAHMSISEETVKVHIKNILEKMGARDRTQAVVMAIKQRLIPV